MSYTNPFQFAEFFTEDQARDLKDILDTHSPFRSQTLRGVFEALDEEILTLESRNQCLVEKLDEFEKRDRQRVSEGFDNAMRSMAETLSSVMTPVVTTPKEAIMLASIEDKLKCLNAEDAVKAIREYIETAKSETSNRLEA